MWLTVFNIFFFIVLVVFAAFQWNDPDALVWMSMYLYTALWCGLAVLGTYSPIGYIIGMAVYLPYATYLFFAEDGVRDWITKHKAASITASMAAKKPWIEKTREFFGLLIATAVLLVNYVSV